MLYAEMCFEKGPGISDLELRYRGGLKLAMGLDHVTVPIAHILPTVTYLQVRHCNHKPHVHHDMYKYTKILFT